MFKARPLRLAGPVYLVGRAPPGSVLDIDNVEFVRRGWRGAVVEIPVPRRPEARLRRVNHRACPPGGGVTDITEDGGDGALGTATDRNIEAGARRAVRPSSVPSVSSVAGRSLGRSEIVGLSVVWDRKPDTVPQETVTQRVSPWLAGKTFRLTSLPRLSSQAVPGLDSRGAPGRSASDVKGGPWYLHARFLDGAGNWGEPGHLEVDFGGR